MSTRRPSKTKPAAGRRHALCEARRLIAQEYRRALASEPGVLQGQSMPLHDLRVAIRRLALLLRTFRTPLTATSAARMETAVRRLGKALGPARDLDVWMLFLNSNAPENPGKTPAAWAAFLRRQESLKFRQKERMKRLLASAACRNWKAGMNRLLQAEIPAAFHEAKGDLSVLETKAIRKALSRVRERHALCQRYEPEEAHHLRRAIRKARYLCDYFGEGLGGPVPELGERLKRMQAALGRIHDRDVWCGLLRRQKFIPPRKLLRQLRKERASHLAEFKKAWKHFNKPSFQKDVQRALRPALHSGD